MLSISALRHLVKVSAPARAARGSIALVMVLAAVLGSGALAGCGSIRSMILSSCSASAYPPGAQYTFERCSSSNDPVGWPRCSQVTYSVDPAAVSLGYLPDLKQAIGQLSVATGLRLVQVDRAPNISISFDPSLYAPAPGTSGEAGVTEYRVAAGVNGAHATSAAVRVSSHLRPGSSPGVGVRPVMLHELGHAVGLGHYSGAVVMNPLDRGFSAYQAGDLAGFRALYDPGACASR